MRVFTSYLRPDRPPVMVREGFSFAAFLFGWIYLLWRRAWIAAVLNLLAGVLAFRLAAMTGSLAPLFGLLVLQGVFGHDLWRWGLTRQGFTQGPVIAATDRDAALARLIGTRPDLFQTLSSARI